LFGLPFLLRVFGFKGMFGKHHFGLFWVDLLQEKNEFLPYKA